MAIAAAFERAPVRAAALPGPPAAAATHIVTRCGGVTEECYGTAPAGMPMPGCRCLDAEGMPMPDWHRHPLTATFHAGAAAAGGLLESESSGTVASRPQRTWARARASVRLALIFRVMVRVVRLRSCARAGPAGDRWPGESDTVTGRR